MAKYSLNNNPIYLYVHKEKGVHGGKGVHDANIFIQGVVDLLRIEFK